LVSWQLKIKPQTKFSLPPTGYQAQSPLFPITNPQITLNHRRPLNKRSAIPITRSRAITGAPTRAVFLSRVAGWKSPDSPPTAGLHARN
jgi:hypothetical protein